VDESKLRNSSGVELDAGVRLTPPDARHDRQPAGSALDYGLVERETNFEGVGIGGGIGGLQDGIPDEGPSSDC
jgi:hypothetical protein